MSLVCEAALAKIAKLFFFLLSFCQGFRFDFQRAGKSLFRFVGVVVVCLKANVGLSVATLKGMRKYAAVYKQLHRFKDVDGIQCAKLKCKLFK